MWPRHTTRFSTLLALYVAVGVGARSWAADRFPFADAVAVCQMGEPQTGETQLHGNVRMGVELQGAEKQASLARGGDGKIAVFDGGYLILGEGKGIDRLNGAKAMTLCMRVRDPQGRWDVPLLSTNNPADELACILQCAETDRSQVGFREATRLESEAYLEYRWRTDMKDKSPGDWGVTPDFSKGVLRVGVPVDLIGPEVWHDVVIRFTGPRLEMFIDGVLVDEEWPHGALSGLTASLLVGAGYEKGKLKTGFRGQIDHVAVWNRALRDDEVAVLSGGKSEVARRTAEILGNQPPEMQYWRPQGHNAFVGDVMLFFHEGRLHVFYLYDRRHHRSKWGLGAHQFGHMSTKDLVHWEQHPMALPITDQTECSLGTGCFVFRDGTYYLYYIQHGRRLNMADAPYRGDNIFVATSRDGVHFTKAPKPVVRMEYTRGGDINPHVIATETGNRFLMTVSGWKVYSSDNLVDWAEVDAPQLSSIKWICTTDFTWNDWRYFTGCGNYVMSKRPIEETKAWTTPTSPALADSLGVPVVSEFTGNRYIYAGFATGGGYAQELVFRELVQEKDGALGMKWPEEMIPKSGQPISLSIAPVKGQSTASGSGVRVSSREDFACAMAKDMPQNARITLRAKPQPGTKDFGLCCRGDGAYESGCELRFEPGKRRVQYSRPVRGESSAESRDGPGMDQAPGLDREFTIDLIVKDDLVDVCVGNRRTLLSRNSATGDRLFFFVRGGEVLFDDIQVRPLLSQLAPRAAMAPGGLLFENSDFEMGNLTNWIAQGDAFDHAQPTKGDNTKARGREPSQHQGDYWVGTYERFDGKAGKPGDARGDGATGTLTSVEFTIEDPWMSFLVSGGAMRDDEYVALVVDGQEVRKATGHVGETMRRVVWNVSPWQGKKARVLIKDASKEAWGVINADDFRYCVRKTP